MQPFRLFRGCACAFNRTTITRSSSRLRLLPHNDQSKRVFAFPELLNPKSFWRCSVTRDRGAGAAGRIVIERGHWGGKVQVNVNERAVLCGKNIGKSNETTPFSQACKEAESRWTF